MDWKTYEEITKNIYETLGEKNGVTIEGYGKDCKVKGKSGVEHQIDVLTSHSDGIHKYKTAIECKYWQATINKDIIMKVAEIVEDAAINKGVIVSKLGFTPDAISFAKYKNIGLVELREARNEEKEEKETQSKIRFISSTLYRSEIISILFVSPPWIKVKENQERVDPALMIIRTNDSKEFPLEGFINEFKNELRSHDVEKIIEKKVRLSNSRLINTSTKESLIIEGFVLKGVLTARDAGLKFHSADEVWLIMKSIFEESSYTISIDGRINETKKGNN
jgi:hypothetical protein